ncbi:MAG: double-strand break repair helicase AddA, partial [Sphingomonadales bacterium]
PGGLKIQTIHSFCQSLLSRFPLEARLAPHFKVMDERTAAGFLKEASDAVMDGAGEKGREALFKAFSHIAGQTNEDGFQEVLRAFLMKRGEILAQLGEFGGPDGLIEATYESLGVDPGETREDILKSALSADKFPEQTVQNLKNVLLAGSKSEVGHGDNLQKFFESKSDSELAFQNYKTVFFTLSGDPRKTIFVKATMERHPNLVGFFEEEQKRLATILNHLAMQRVAENTASLIRLGTTILVLYQQEKARFGYLDYDDLILKTKDLLAREGITPWILYKLDGGIDHILVDEAQDTNKVQWGMVEALAGEFFAGLGTAGEAIRTVFAVGDPKQSIYRFQGAEPGEYRAAQKRIEARVKAAGLTFKIQDLSKSFRSTRVVLDVVDSVFKLEATRDGMRRVDEEIKHQAHRVGMAGLVEVWPPEMPIEGAQKPEGWQLPFEQKFSPKPEATLAAKIATHIHALVRTGETLKARGRAIRYGDIMVLVQRRGPFMDHLIRELKGRSVPVAGSDRMALSEQLVVQDLLALGRFALLPDDDFTLAVVLKGPLLNFDDDDLMDLAIGRAGSLWKAFKGKAGTNKRYQKSFEFLKEVLGFADFVTPFSFYSKILGPLKGRALFIRRLGTEVGDPLDEFISLAQEFQNNNTPSLQGFLKWFEASETQIKRDMERGVNEVRIMTIHGAKGLEAPIVYLPDTHRTLRKRSDTLLKLPSGLSVWSGKTEFEKGQVEAAREALMKEEKAELNRLLYVALTRAEDRLYVSGWQGAKASKEPTWFDAIHEAVSTNPAVQEILAGDGTRLRLEPEQVGPAKPDDEALLKVLGEVELPAWVQNPVKDQEPGFEALQPSKAEGGLCVTPGEFKEGKDRAIRRGTIIHKLLEILPEIPPTKRTPLMTTYLKGPSLQLSPAEQLNIKERVSGVLGDPDFKALFAPGSRAEVNIAGVVEGRLASGQVDRVAITKDEVLIVDYKSNRGVPENIEQAPPAYIRQLQLYARLLGQVYPGKKVRACLLWTETGALMEVPEENL